MLRNYFKIGIRHLLKNRSFSLLNIFGLALGLAAFIVISLYVNYEKSYDTFDGSENVYRVYMDYLEGNRFVPGDAQTYNLSGPTLKNEFPEIEEQVRLYRLEKVTFTHGEKVIEQPNGSLTDPTFFDIFNLKVIKGSQSDFNKPNTIILTRSLSKKIFGNENPIGQTLSVFYGSEGLMEVVAVIEDIPENTHMRMNFLISFETMKTWGAVSGQAEPNWNQNNFFTYLKVPKNADAEALRAKITASDFEEDPDERHNIEPISEIHLYSDKPYEAEANGSIERVRFLSAIAFAILILSWLNYINLATAKSLERSREVGVRKVAGANRSQLVLQSLTESLVLNVLAFLLAIVLVYLLLPVFNGFVGKPLQFDFMDLSGLISIFGFILIGTLLAGLYPAFVISGFAPVKALKGKVQVNRSSIGIRKGLITLQFFATAVLVIGTLVVGEQLHFLREQPIGVDLAQVVAIKGEILETQPDSLTQQKFKTLEGELNQLPFVDAISRSSTYPGDGYDNLSSTVGITGPNGETDERQLFYIYSATPDYFKTLNLHFAAGGAFLPNEENIVMNETFSRQMGFANPEEIVGKTVKFWGRDWKVSGVVEDYHHFGLKDKIAPLIVCQVFGMENLLVKINNSENSTVGIANSLAVIQKKWKAIFPQSTLDYTFLDQKFGAQYEEDRKFGIAFQIFTGLAIFIAALGLFGLSSYTILKRRKEIGIRKVSGASVLQILTLLNKDFLKWVCVAFVFAAPVGWYLMTSWLNGFAYKTMISWWVYAISGAALLITAILAVSFQAIKAAVANPVKSLRTE
ncbi:MAG: ABC transporter permease [Leeuwenhoekiella sp.]